MKCLLIALFTTALLLAQTQKDTAAPPASKTNNTGIKPRVAIVPKTEEEIRAATWAVIQQGADRYKRARLWLDQMTAKYKNEPGEEENQVLGRHYAELADEYERAAVPIAEQLLEDIAYYQDDASPQNTLEINTMIVESQHLELILAGLQTEDRKWLRNHAKDRVEPGIVIVVK